MEKKTKIIDGKEYTYVSLDESKDFFCARCKKNKKSKKYNAKERKSHCLRKDAFLSFFECITFI